MNNTESKYFNKSKLPPSDTVYKIVVCENMGWYRALARPSSICQYCFDFAFSDRCTKPNIDGAQIELRPVPCSAYGDDTYYVKSCPYFVYRRGTELNRVTLGDLSVLTGLGVPVLRRMSVEEINKIICNINCECVKIKSTIYIRSIRV